VRLKNNFLVIRRINLSVICAYLKTFAVRELTRGPIYKES